MKRLGKIKIVVTIVTWGITGTTINDKSKNTHTNTLVAGKRLYKKN